MARIELSNIGGGGGGGSTTLALTTTGTSGASVLTTVPGGYSLNIPVYQGALSLSTAGTSGASTLVGNTLTIPTYQGQISLTTTGTSGASTFVGNTLNIPTYQGAISLTTTGTSGAATLVGNTLNVPQYSTAPAGSTGEIQYNNAGAFAASSNLAWDNSNVQLNVGAPSAPTAKLNVRGGGATSATSTQVWTNSGNTELMRVRDDGNVGISTASPAARVHIVGPGSSSATWTAQFQNSTGSNNALMVRDDGRVGIGTNSPERSLHVVGLSVFKAGILSNSVTPEGSTLTIGGANAQIVTNPSGVPGFVYNIQNGVQNRNDGGYYGTFTTAHQFVVSSGTSRYTGLDLSNTINQTGTATGTTRGLYVNPTLTSATDWRSIEFSNNSGYGLYGSGSANNYLAGNTVIGTTTPSARFHVRGSNTSSGTNALLVQNSNPDDIYKIENDGKVSYLATNTAAGTTGAQTINRPSGTVNFAAGATSLVVTNSLCTTASIVFAEVRTNDATAQIKNVVPAGGSFTINLSAAATAETSVGFFIIN